MNVNKAILVGRVTRDPDVRNTASGQAVTNIGLATNNYWTDKAGQKQEKTEWSRIVVWGKIAELCNRYLSKGRQVYLEGKLATRSWEDQEGHKKYTTEVIANNVQFLGSNPNANAGGSQGPGKVDPPE